MVLKCVKKRNKKHNEPSKSKDKVFKTNLQDFQFRILLVKFYNSFVIFQILNISSVEVILIRLHLIRDAFSKLGFEYSIYQAGGT